MGHRRRKRKNRPDKYRGKPAEVKTQATPSPKNIDTDEERFMRILELLEGMKSPTGSYRCIIELTPMHHNDEVVVYTPEQVYGHRLGVLQEYMEGLKNANMFNTPKLMLCRPVFEFEREIIRDRGIRKHKEEVENITRVLDCMFDIKHLISIKRAIRFVKDAPAIDGSEVLAFIIGNDFYDCMTGGCTAEMIQVYRCLCQMPGMDLSTEVYPGPKGWYTLRDFLKETHDDDDILPLVKKCLSVTSLRAPFVAALTK